MGNYDHNIKIKKNIGSDISTILSEFMEEEDTNNDYNLNETYVGKVIDNMDPERLGRCKIVVYGVFSEVSTPTQLPWAIPEFGFVGSLKGSFIVPQIGAFVKVTFENNEINLPKYSTKVLNVTQLPTNKDKNYPNNMVFFETDKGDSFEMDRITSEATFTHFTGSSFTIDPLGNVTIKSVGNISTEHGLFLMDDGVQVIPTGTGPYMAIPIDPITGMIQTGQQCSPKPPTP